MMLLPYQVDVPMERWPYANWALIAVTSVIGFIMAVGIHLGAGKLTDVEKDQLRQRLIREHPNANADQIEDRAEQEEEDSMVPGALRPGRWAFLHLFTYLFVHSGFLHLIGNMIFLFVFGNAVNAKIGHAQYLLAYFLLGAFSGAAWLLLGDGRPVVGASGAIMGLVGMFLILYPRNDVTVLYWISWFYHGEFSISSYWLILFYVVGDLFGTLIQQVSGVAYVTHIAGAFLGAGIAATLVAVGYLPPARGEENLLQFIGLMDKQPKKKKKKRKKVKPVYEDDA